MVKEIYVMKVILELGRSKYLEDGIIIFLILLII